MCGSRHSFFTLQSDLTMSEEKIMLHLAKTSRYVGVKPQLKLRLHDFLFVFFPNIFIYICLFGMQSVS